MRATERHGWQWTSSTGRSRKWIGSFYAELGGLDMLVFTGGIGENDIAVRAEICAGLGALGIVLDPGRNNVRGEAVISAEDSPVTVRVIPPAEDLIIVNHVADSWRHQGQASSLEAAFQPADTGAGVNGRLSTLILTPGHYLTGVRAATLRRKLQFRQDRSCAAWRRPSGSSKQLRRFPAG